MFAVDVDGMFKFEKTMAEHIDHDYETSNVESTC